MQIVSPILRALIFLLLSSRPIFAQSEVLRERSEPGALMGVSILGQVKNPGYYRVSVSSRLSKVLRDAGGLLPNAASRMITLTRGSKKRTLDFLTMNRKGDQDQDPFLFENDIIHVPLIGRVVQVLGPVRDPGTYELVNEKNLEEVANLAGGFTNGLSQTSNVEVVRFIHGEKKILETLVDSSSLAHFEIVSGDIILFPHVLTANNDVPLHINRLPADVPMLSPFENRVFVTGGVKQAQPAPFDPSYRIPNYLTLSGGLDQRMGRRQVIVRSLSGKTIETHVKDVTTQINPGDTIEVKEKSIPTEFWIGFLATVASISLSAIAITR